MGARVRIQNELVVIPWLWMGEHRGCHQGFFHVLKGAALFWSP